MGNPCRNPGQDESKAHNGDARSRCLEPLAEEKLPNKRKNDSVKQKQGKVGKRDRLTASQSLFGGFAAGFRPPIFARIFNKRSKEQSKTKKKDMK